MNSGLWSSKLKAVTESEAGKRRGAIDDIQKRAGTDFGVCIHGGEPDQVVGDAARAHQANWVVIARGAILGGLGRLWTHACSII